jgi:hypothetical protein
MFPRIRAVARWVASENVAVSMIEYTIMLAIVMAVVVTSAAYTGLWLARKWIVLTAKLI